MSYRYGAWRGGPDPLEPPFDLARALDRLGERVLAGDRAADALADLLRRGMPGTRGLRDLLRQVRERRRGLRERGQLDGTLERVRELLDRAVEQERAALFPDPSDQARLAEAELDQLPPDTARAVRQLADYRWRSPEAAATYEQIRDLLRREVLDTRFKGMRDALARASPEQLQRIRDMLADLNAMLDADARGEDTQRQFDEFMQRYGDMFPENPRTLEELVDALARRAAAASRLAASLTPEQRAELAALAQAVLGDLGLEYELDRLGRALRGRRPDLPWDEGAQIGGDRPLGLGDATTALEELADLESLEASLGQRYPGASLDDVDQEALERTLGRAAVEDVETLRRLERELAEQGYLLREQGELRLSPKAIRRIGAVALRRIFASLEEGRRGDHDVAGTGLAGEPSGASRPWEFGDEDPLDVVRTVRNAVLRRYPQDALEIVGFSLLARTVRTADLPDLAPAVGQGTNLHHALVLAGRHLDRHPEAEPVVLVVTDGEPTAHLERDGLPWFDYPPDPRTIELTLAEVTRLTRRGATINVFMLDDDPRLVRFVDGIARLNGGRVFAASAERLGDYVVSDYLRARRGRRGR